MSYISQLEIEEVELLMDHPDGLKSIQSDFKILEDHKNDVAINNLNEDRVLRESYELKQSFEQKPLFPEIKNY
jgi:hypothetical protein